MRLSARIRIACRTITYGRYANFDDEKKPAQGRLFTHEHRSSRYYLRLKLVRNQLGHLKHRDLSLAEDRAQIGVGVDHAAINGVLQTVLLDVVPHFLGDFRARQWHGANHRSKDR